MAIQHPSLSDNHSRHIDNFVRNLRPTLPVDILRGFVNEVENEICSRNTTLKFQRQNGVQVVIQPITNRNTSNVYGKSRARASVDENRVLCELKYESYCIWHEENKKAMQDFMGKKLKNQLFVIMAYFPNVLKIPIQNKLSGELKQNIQEFEHILGKSTINSYLPRKIQKKSQRMEAAMARFKSVTLDCNNVDKKLGQIFDLIEDETNFHLKQSALLYQLDVQTMSKSLHYVSTRLTMEYFSETIYLIRSCLKNTLIPHCNIMYLSIDTALSTMRKFSHLDIENLQQR
ncbi:hypothetical protein V6N13_142500 [Hibiscus sabdariffa]|uniref:Uncharacterized protein n=1 Tax=Hibiscus sabdariffa TaxID=183260 RepID=A0ABR2FED2_9ROSI